MHNVILRFTNQKCGVITILFTGVNPAHCNIVTSFRVHGNMGNHIQAYRRHNTEPKSHKMLSQDWYRAWIQHPLLHVTLEGDRLLPAISVSWR